MKREESLLQSLDLMNKIFLGFCANVRLSRAIWNLWEMWETGRMAQNQSHSYRISLLFLQRL